MEETRKMSKATRGASKRNKDKKEDIEQHDSDQEIIENITNSYQLNKSKTFSEKNV